MSSRNDRTEGIGPSSSRGSITKTVLEPNQPRPQWVHGRRKWIRPTVFTIADEVTLQKILAPATPPQPEYNGHEYIRGAPGGIADPNCKTFRCTVSNCGAVFLSVSSLACHSNKHKKRTIKCNFCGMIFTQRDTLVLHSQEFHPDIDFIPGANPLKCNKCGSTSRDKKALWRHVRETHHGKTYPCPKCNFPFSRIENLREHLRTKHLPECEEESKFTCKICGKNYAQMNSFRTHIRGSHRGVSKTFQCVLCSTIYLSRQTYRKHMKRHINPKFFHCDICGAAFGSMSHLRRHNNSFRHLQKARQNLMLTKDSLSNFKKSMRSSPLPQMTQESQKHYEPNQTMTNTTTTESFSLNQKQLLQVCNQKTLKILLHRVDSHIVSKSPATLDKRKFQLYSNVAATVTQNRKYNSHATTYYLNCLYCDAYFPNLISVTSHELRCYMEYRLPKVNICSICSKEFAKPYSLGRHMRVHSKDRPFKCPHCDKCFKSKTTLIQHEKSLHFGIRYEPTVKRVFKCNYEGCSKQYRSQKTLKKHVASFHLGLRYTCEKCGRVYRRDDMLRKHLKIDHAEYPMRLPCKPCNRTYKTRTNYLFHLKRKRHHRKALEFQQIKPKTRCRRGRNEIVKP